MPGTKEIKTRIKSVASTKKITRAMQMVSAAKMRKAQAAALSSRKYSELAWQIVTNLADKIDPKYHRLLQTQENSGNQKVGVILVTSNTGLVGSLNSALIASTQKFIAEMEKGGQSAADLTVVGRKGRDAMRRLKKNIVADFPKVDRNISADEVMPIVRMVIDEYQKGNYSKIVIAYNHFISTVNQKPKIVQLLPLEAKEHPGRLKEEFEHKHYEYLFEPDPETVLDYLLPRIILSQIYQAVLESDASEHSARMVMMKNATDAATDLIAHLTLTYNQLRQANITQELAEITAGRIALE